MELARHTGILGAPARVHAIEGGDHSFAVPKKLGIPQADIDAAAQRAVADFIRRPNV